MSLLANSNAIESGGYNIDRSLRFRSSASAYLSRTPASTTNRRTWTVSFWIKRGRLATGTEQIIFSSNNGSTYTELNYLASSDVLRLNLAAGGSPYYFDTSAVFRDPSAWYHVVVAVDTTQATSTDRMKLYINNVQQAGSNNAPSLNYDTDWNRAQPAYIGARTSGSWFNDCYLAEFNNIDGQALTPSSFGQTDATTGVWVPVKYTGTYGTNGFYLNFSDNTSATTLAYDKSGNGNNWTPNNISTTAGATYDSMTDVPTLTSATAANYCVLNPLQSYGTGTLTLTNGNLTSNKTVTNSDSGWTSTFALSSGKWYAEYLFTGSSVGGNNGGVGVMRVASTSAPGELSDTVRWMDAGTIRQNAVNTSYGTALVANDILMVAFDADNNRIWFGKNGTWFASGNPATNTNPSATGLTNPMVPATYHFAANVVTIDANFGQRPFSYTPPTGFKALNTFNLPDPTIKKGGSNFNAVPFSGTGSNQSITGFGFAPDFVWIKKRSAAEDHKLFDTIRGAINRLASNTTGSETADNDLYGFTSDGFDGSLDSATYASWNWKAGGTAVTNTAGSITSQVSANPTAGFSVVTYTGTGVNNASVGHGLGVAPAMIIVKDRTNAYNWDIYHKSLGIGATLIFTTAATRNVSAFGSSNPSSTVFYTQNSYTNSSGANFVAYCFSEIAGYSKFGSYTGNGSTDGSFIYTGFRPAYVMIKRTDTVNDWAIHDKARIGYNVANYHLIANSSGAEFTDIPIDFLSNGFKLRGTSGTENASGGTYIFAAFAENPFKYSNAR